MAGIPTPLAEKSAGRLNRENRQLRQAVTQPRSPRPLTGQSLATKGLLQQIKKISRLDSTVLLTGETGVGKSLVAQMIHYGGARREGPFVTVSCTALPRDLVESELFGHEKGAFTGAHERRPRCAEMAHTGTLFLDETGDMLLDLQPKLLNFIQERSFQRVGGNRTIVVDVRVIAATHQDLRTLCSQKQFREDLYFRLNVLPVHIPPLRRAKEDISVLVHEFLAEIARCHKRPFQISDQAIQVLQQYERPGNIRELENVLERTAVFSERPQITPQDLPREIFREAEAETGANLAGMTWEEIERLAVKQTLELCKGNRLDAARRLGISEKSIYNKIKKFNL